MLDSWLSARSRTFSSSGIRKVFDLGAKLEDPINLSIGQPDFDMPEEAHQGAIEAIQAGKSSYTPTQGSKLLIDRIQADVDAKYHDSDRKAFITSGTSGGLLLVALAFVNPGDEVITSITRPRIRPVTSPRARKSKELRNLRPKRTLFW